MIPFVGFGQYNGKGTAIYKSGKYEGEFRNGIRDGKGTYTWVKSGNRYIGEWKNGKRHGEGTVIINKDKKYIGLGFEHKLDSINNYTTVLKIYPNSPAQNSGLSVGDIILSANNNGLNFLKSEKNVGERYKLKVKKYVNNKIEEIKIKADYIKHLDTDTYEYSGHFNKDKLNGIVKLLLFNGEEQISVYENGEKIDSEEYIKKYVEKRINEWQKKGEFEKTSVYRNRVNEINRTSKIEDFQSEAISTLENQFIDLIDLLDFNLGDYDADNETFILENTVLGKYILSVPMSKAKKFKLNYNYSTLINPKCILTKNGFYLSSFDVKINGLGVFSYNQTQSDEYQTYKFDYNFSAIELDDITSSTKNLNLINTNKISVGNSKVDIDIPKNKKVKNRYAIVIGNENYSSFQKTLEREQDVPFAVNDANTFKKYVLEALGVEKEHLYFIENATSGQMNQTIDLVTKIVSKLGNKAELIFYYAGHGFPDEFTKEPYLIPVDVSTSYLNNAISLDDLYDKFSKTGAKRVIAFVDACFSGGARENSLLVSRGVKINPKMTNISNNLVVFSASSETQSALPYNKENHGMFTFYLLNKLKESSGKISLGELYDYISEEVSLNSLKINQTEQEPNVIFSPTIENKWRDWQLY